MFENHLYNMAAVLAAAYLLFLAHFYISVHLGKAHSSRYRALALHFGSAAFLSAGTYILQVYNGLFTLENALWAASATCVHGFIFVAGIFVYRKINASANLKEALERREATDAHASDYIAKGFYVRPETPQALWAEPPTKPARK